MRFIINNIKEDINNYRRRKRYKPNYFLKYFLIWISLILLITLVYLYIIDEFEIVNKIIKEPITIIKEPIKQVNEKIIKQLPERSKLYEEIMNTVSNIPKPLNFVDNFSFDL
jgi:hypothetical protein